MFKVGDRIRWARNVSLWNNLIGTVVDSYRTEVAVRWDGAARDMHYDSIDLVVLVDPNDILKGLL